jgi:hypothetical protein
VALVYPVRKRLMTTRSRLVIVLVSGSLYGVVCALSWLWSCFPIFLVVIKRIFSFIHAFKSCGGYVSVW